MEEIADQNIALQTDILEKRDVIDYKSSKPYKNRILKEQEWLKSKGEKVLYITSQEDYEKYTAPYKLEITEIDESETNSELDGLTNIEKWQRFLFGK